jgi:acyl-coenzyme A thioesterase PaaI-like protein
MHKEFALGVINSIKPIARTGMSIQRLDENTVQVRMPISGNENHKGLMYAGSLFSLAESAPGILFLNRYGDGKIAPICSGVDIRFRRPALTDVTISLEIEDEIFDQLHSTTIESGKASAKFESNIVDDDGNVVSTASINYVLLRI